MGIHPSSKVHILRRVSDLERFASEELAAVEALEEATAAVLFQTAEGHRSGTDQMMWQVPALSLTGQAFLLQTAYGPSTSWSARLVTAALGLVIAMAAI